MKRPLSAHFIVAYDSYVIDTVLKNLWNRNYAYCTDKEMKPRLNQVKPSDW